ncbi:MAG: dihydroorotate dehydrogenase electron transfer subunit [Clostridiales bacterium]|nr:dihydroorotate dehydrogenase electron transfer subunit [Candidatus Crickella equi]
MKQGKFEIINNDCIAAGIWKMVLAGDTSAITAAGQFINIQLDGHFLRRPISVHDVNDEEVTIIYKVLGHGTEEMTQLPVGTELDILTGLGNGYSLAEAGDRPLLIGGGVGIPPLYNLAKRLLAEQPNRKVQLVLGFNKADEMFCVDEFKELGCEVIIATADGSCGIKGFVTDAIKDLDYSYFYTCGPEAMLRALFKVVKTDGQMSFEERMGCGFGACMGCSCQTITGYKRICKDGPVLRKEELLW